MLDRIKISKELVLFFGAAVVMYLSVVLCRPLLPVDETRYMSVAWEMYMRGDWLAPLTRNFEPYHHKPPMLFWMINLFWDVFGVSRWAGTLPIFIMTFANLWAVQKIYRKIFDVQESTRVSWIFLGSVPLIAYGTVVMFDFGMSLLTMLSVLCLISFLETTQKRWMILMGFVMGLAVLMKGPVAYLYVAPIVLLAPYWSRWDVNRSRLYRLFGLSFLVSVLPVLAWLIPVVMQTDNQFAFWLVWNQTAGRVTGNFSASHARPIYFYLMMLPAFFAPWLFFPQFWTQAKILALRSKPMLFVAAYTVPAFIAFSFISGKQAHYMIPLMPAVMMLIAWLLRDVSQKTVMSVSLSLVFVFMAAHVGLQNNFLKKYELVDVAAVAHDHQGHGIAWVSNYHAEVGFIGRLTEKVDDVDISKLPEWFEAHPDGIAVVRHSGSKDVSPYKELIDRPYRGKSLGVYKRGE